MTTPVTDGERGGLIQALTAGSGSPGSARCALSTDRATRGSRVRGPGRGVVVRRGHRLAARLDEQMRPTLGLTRGIPSGTTVWRVLTRIDAGLLTAIVAGWLRSGNGPAVIATLRNTPSATTEPPAPRRLEYVQYHHDERSRRDDVLLNGALHTRNDV
jgi:hypothetical protein